MSSNYIKQVEVGRKSVVVEAPHTLLPMEEPVHKHSMLIA